MKKGFTLAEELITLGIIGIVAALTIPGLMQNIKGVQYRAKLKDTISILNQAVRMNQAKYDFNFADTNVGYTDVGSNEHIPDKIMSVAAIFNANLSGADFNANTLLFPQGEGCTDWGDVIGDFNSETMLKIFSSGSTLSNEFFGYLLPNGATVNISFWAVGCTMPKGGKVADVKSSTQTFDDCIGYIDLDGYQGMNKEVRCSDGKTTKFEPEKPCVVKNTDISDVYPIVIHDSTVELATNAGKYVFNSAK